MSRPAWKGTVVPRVPVSELLVRASLADFDETKLHEDRVDLARREDGNVAHLRRP